MPAQRGDAQRGQRDDTTTAALGVVVVEDTTAALSLLTDVEDPVVQVEIRPPETDDLAPAEPHRDGEHEGRVERILTGGGEEVERLVERPGLQLPVVRARRLDELGDVTRDQLLTAGGGAVRRDFG